MAYREVNIGVFNGNLRAINGQFKTQNTANQRIISKKTSIFSPPYPLLNNTSIQEYLHHEYFITRNNIPIDCTDVSQETCHGASLQSHNIIYQKQFIHEYFITRTIFPGPYRRAAARLQNLPTCHT